MRFTYLYFLIIPFLMCACWASDLIEVNREKNVEFQSSAFIQLMNKLNQGKIPYPFSKLLDSFGTNARKESIILLVPEGRSLVKKHANFRNPRIILDPLSTNNSTLPLGPDLSPAGKQRQRFLDMGISSGDIYIGFVPNHKALEIISYNPKKQEYDFFVVEDYEKDKIPKIVSNPSLCLSCHQNKGPIFSRFPWKEITGGLDKKTQDRMKQMILEYANNKKEIEGIDLSVILDKGNVNSFDFSVREGNKVLLSNQVCQALCPKSNSLECQQNLILEALKEKPTFDSLDQYKDLEDRIMRLSMKSSVIPDRDPFTNEGFKIDSITDVDYLHSDSGNYDLTYFEGELFFNTSKTTIITDKSFIDPTTSRPIHSLLVKLQYRMKKLDTLQKKVELAVEQCLPLFELKDINKKTKITKELLNYPEVKSVLSLWPHTREIPIKIEKAIKPVTTTEISCEKTNMSLLPIFEMKDFTVINERLLNEKVSRPQLLFNKYCMQCHGGSNSFISLPLESIKDLANYTPTFSDNGVFKRLSEKSMPPEYATQPSEVERKIMIEVIKELQNVKK